MAEGESGADDKVPRGHSHAGSSSAASPLRAWGNVPPRNPAFTGRETQLAAVYEALTTSKRVAVQALHGMGGVGKTQLAIEYTYRHPDDYDVVWWLDAENPALLSQQFNELADKLGCTPAVVTPETIMQAVRDDLHHRARWLLVFDNAAGPEDVRAWLPTGPGHAIITSRASNWTELAIGLSVHTFSRAEAIEFLRTRIGCGPGEDAHELAAALGDLPLALAQAAAFLADTGMSAAEYRRLLHNRAAELLRESKPASYDSSLTAATILIWEQLRQTDRDAARIVLTCAHLAPEPIPIDWFAAAAGAFPDQFPADLADPLRRGRLVKTITDTALARQAEDGLIMHRLTQSILRTGAPADESRAASASAERVIFASHPGDQDLPQNWPTWARYLPHVLALDLDRTDILRRTADDAIWYLIRNEQHRQAHDIATHLYGAWTRRLGQDHPDTLWLANTCSATLRRRGMHEQARVLDENALAGYRALYGYDHPTTLHSAHYLMSVLTELGEHQKALELGLDTLQRSRHALGPNDPDTLRTANILGSTLRELGDHAAARELNEETLQRRRQALGEDHPATLRSASRRARDLREMGEPAQARELDEDVLRRRLRLYGPDHPETAQAKADLAEDQRLLGSDSEDG